ncbi:hypothetical protein GCK72_001913 [Caenorhabditis remanei]|uniref:Exonuclease domain-containing protein n=1 Tax=Caenorhabditis remanei TaxID=31234 RepID=A0A6A5HR60_CAERE|nr:hypothetical protein GCK72_001913 [Caenorhabditis remanei]KAF1770095.1 hypothetical protein GCK72_001913 [Caenorhabditis remanei]
MGDQVYIQPSVYEKNTKMFYAENDLIRVCIRCRSSFQVENDGLQRISNSKYVCKDSNGMMYRFHIHNQHPMENLKKFKRAPKVTGSNWNMSGKMYALDVESVYTSHGQAVGRVTVVDCFGATVIDAIVKPKDAVHDCVTKYSGLTLEHFKYATETIESIREKIFDYINEQSILVGHALNGDLKALGIIHDNVIDTSILYSVNGRRPSLRQLTSTHLKYEIQNGSGGHCSKEDAVASLQLVYFGAMNPTSLSPFYQEF